ncbi:MAG: hypothetical protein MJZ04_09540 [Bacteroidales bacterium]|nr:hypothetical protein [Bacteroidales bacterium]
MCSDRFLPYLSALVLVCSCSVKEDRVECPCFLTLDWSAVDCWTLMEAGNDGLDWMAVPEGGGEVQAGSLALESAGPYTELSVPKDTVCVSVSCGGVAGPDGSVTVEDGHGFPRLFFHTSSVDATGAVARDTIHLHREHAELFLYVRNVMMKGASYTVEGTVAGCDRYGHPVPGHFSASVDTDSRGFGSVVLPRQCDGSLRLNVSYAGDVVRSLAIGEYIIQSGYDWTVEDLGDISMEIDYFQTKVTVRVEQWKKTLTFTIVF